VDLLPAKVDRFMAASLHGTGDIRQYETLYPIHGEKPDLFQPKKFGEIDLDVLIPGFREETNLSDRWQKALKSPVIANTVIYMWDGTPIENDHDHKNTFCTFFFKGEFHLVARYLNSITIFSKLRQSLGVSFINILSTNFLYERRFGSFSLVTCL